MCDRRHCEPAYGRFYDEIPPYEEPPTRPPNSVFETDNRSNGLPNLLIKCARIAADIAYKKKIKLNGKSDDDDKYEQVEQDVATSILQTYWTAYLASQVTDVCRATEPGFQSSLFIGKDCQTGSDDQGKLVKSAAVYMLIMADFRVKAIYGTLNPAAESEFDMDEAVDSSISDPLNPKAIIRDALSSNDERSRQLHEDKTTLALRLVAFLKECEAYVLSLEDTDPIRFAWFIALIAYMQDLKSLDTGYENRLRCLDDAFSDFFEVEFIYHETGSLNIGKTLDTLVDQRILVFEAKNRGVAFSKVKTKVAKEIQSILNKLGLQLGNGKNGKLK